MSSNVSAPHTAYNLSNTLSVPITSQYASRYPRTPLPHLKLCGVNLQFVWQTDADDDPFSAQCPLPFLTMLNDVIGRFVTVHLARRYPLIFGKWAKQLAGARKSLEVLYSSINAIIRLSPNDDLKEQVRPLKEVRADL